MKEKSWMEKKAVRNVKLHARDLSILSGAFFVPPFPDGFLVVCLAFTLPRFPRHCHSFHVSVSLSFVVSFFAPLIPFNNLETATKGESKRTK